MSGLLAWLTRLIGGWIPIGTKPFPEWLGKVLWAVGICFVVIVVVDKLFPPKPQMSTTIGSGGTQIVYQERRDVAGFGCNMWRAYIKAGVKQD